MTQRIRLLIVMARPAVVILLGLFAATGLAQAGRPDDPLLLFRALLVVAGFLVCSVVVNDFADEAIDRVNLSGDPSRPLVTGYCGRTVYAAVGASAAATALVAALLLHPLALVVVAAGLAVSIGYSVRPVRLADRGAVASLILPAAYVAVPYLVGFLAARHSLRPADLALLAGLYVGFVGRILLKDFRDVRGDALFGKRTFLVRHGRRRTCQFSAACWLIGATAILVTQHDAALTAAYTGIVTMVLVLLRHLVSERNARREEAIISAIAILGRGMIVVLIGHLSMTVASWPAARAASVTMAIAAVVVGAAWSMARRGPTSRLTVPADWAQRSGSRNFSNSHHSCVSYGASPHSALSRGPISASAPCGEGR